MVEISVDQGTEAEQKQQLLSSCLIAKQSLRQLGLGLFAVILILFSLQQPRSISPIPFPLLASPQPKLLILKRLLK